MRSKQLTPLPRRASLILATLIVAFPIFDSLGAITPVNLRSGQRVNPRGIGDVTPRLSWELQSDAQGTSGRGEVQSAYQIYVGSTAGAADLWDSGKVSSSQTIDVLYAGQPLTSGKQVFWQVRVYDGGNNVSAWSAPAQWSMGLLSTSDWSAQWIGYDAAYNLSAQQATANALFNTSGLNWIQFPTGSQTPGLEQTLLRKQIVLPSNQTVTNAVFALYADNYCVPFVNGQQMSNAAVRWEATARINVTPWLHSGTNQLAIGATNSDAQQPASVIGQLVVQYSSGTVTNFPVDTSWKTAQQAATNWTQLSFNDSGWTTPASGGTPWGTPANNDLARMPAPYLRKNFSVSQPVTRATVYVTALGAYELHLNGQKVGNDVLTPGWTQFSKRVYYQTYDVTAMVQSGSNTIGAILGDGWFASDIAFKGARNNYGGVPRFMAQLVLTLGDGSTQTVVTDPSWTASYGPIKFGDLLMGSEYDARLEMPLWDTTNFNGSAWSPVAVGVAHIGGGYSNVTAIVQGYESFNQLNFTANNSTMGGDPAYGIAKTLQISYQLGGTNMVSNFAENSVVTLGGGGYTLTIVQALYGDPNSFPNNVIQVQAAVTEPARSFEHLAPTNLTVPKPGIYTFDLGQNMVGWVRLTVSGNAGDRITVRQGEMLNPDGSVYCANLRGANAADFYTFATNGTATFEPRFTFHGFRYVEIRGLSVPPTLSSVTGIVVHSDITPTGSFACSSPLVNQLYSNIIWGQKGNYLEVPTDCPQRDERLGWTGDTEFFVPTAAYNFDVQSFFRRHLVTLCEDSQHADGSFAVVAPDMGVGSGGTGWGDAGWICPYNMYRAYGDTNVIADHYAAMQRCGNFDAAYANNYVISSLPGDYGDWVNLGGGASSKVIDTAFYAYYAQAMSEMAAAIGLASDSASYATLHSNIVAAFASFFNPDGSFADGSSQTGYALAFTLNLVPPSLRTLAAQQYATTIANFDDHLATGFIGTPRLLPGLHAAGRDDLAYQLLLQKTYPSWLYQVTLGATTMWERWDGWLPGAGFETVGMNSFNHYAFGSVGEYLYSDVGGIKSATPGYQTIQIQPVVGSGLTWAATTFNSTRGFISTAWTNTGGALNLSVVIPPNTTAQIYVPATNASAITESGVPAAQSPGVSYVGMSNGYAIYSVGSGHYFWSSAIPVIAQPPAVVESDSVYSSGSFPPLPPGDLLTNSTTTVVSNTITTGPENHITSAALTDGIIGTPGSTNHSYEISGGAITYRLGAGPRGTGYTITNLLTYAAWQDDGRENQNYAVNYSIDGVNFYPIASVSYNPSGYPVHDGTDGTMTSLTVSNLTGVQYLQWNFSSSQQNGGVGYTEIAAYGPPTPSVPTSLAVISQSSGSFVMSISGLLPGRNYIVQSTTNLVTGPWITETNFVPTQPVFSFTNATAGIAQKFYQVVEP